MRFSDQCISMLLLCFLTSISAFGQDWLTPYEKSNGQSSATYDEVIAFYEALAAQYPEVRVQQIGRSDYGDPIYFVTISHGDPWEHSDNRLRFMINNGIHPGEPCGVDASMMMVRELVQNPERSAILDRLTLGIIPLYNVGGARNRSCCTRANQVGPDQQGFRGNARNLDLNRDFMKMDSRNTRAFSDVFHAFLPHFFVDTHTTNGADYQAPITYIATLADKLEPSAGRYLREVFVPEMHERADKIDLKLIPYVNAVGGAPEEGMAAFLDLPRYTSGYAAMFQTIGFISEAHMLKSFAQRVDATYEYLYLLLEQAHDDAPELVAAVETARRSAASQSTMAVSWRLDTTFRDSVQYFGYESSYRPGAVTGVPRLFYDTSRPFTAEIPYFPHYDETTVLKVPQAYIIPQAWTEIIDKLQINKVELKELAQDTTLMVEGYYLQTALPDRAPYEGHYYHSEVETVSADMEISFRQGDVVVFTDQFRCPYIVHGLEPTASDSWFRWNFFDAILMQKEYFSPYLFEEVAAELLRTNPVLSREFADKKEREPDFAKNPYQQLFFIYSRSPYYEATHRRYPVARWNGGKLPVK